MGRTPFMLEQAWDAQVKFKSEGLLTVITTQSMRKLGSLKKYFNVKTSIKSLNSNTNLLIEY